MFQSKKKEIYNQNSVNIITARAVVDKFSWFHFSIIYQTYQSAITATRTHNYHEDSENIRQVASN